MRRLISKATAHLLAFVIVASAAGYSVAGVHTERERDCHANNQLREDVSFVLKGAGRNERAQLRILNRVATPAEQAELAKTFEPGLASAIERVERGIQEC